MNKDTSESNNNTSVKKEEPLSKEKTQSQSSLLKSTDKKSLTPKELIDMLKEALYRVLIIDVRSKPDFESSHLSLNLMLTEEKQRAGFVYINVPTDCVYPVAWNIQDALERVDATSAARFAERRKFDYLVVFDRESRLQDLKDDSLLGVFKRAVYDYDQDALRNEPIVLDGGWKHWIAVYPTLVSKVSDLSEKAGQSKTSIDKMFNIEYPELFDKTKAKTVPVKPAAQQQPPVQQPLTTLVSTNEVRLEPVLNEEPPTNKDARNEPQPQPQQQQPSNKTIPIQETKSDANFRTIERPSFDRSNKPGTNIKIIIFSKNMFEI